MSQPPPDRVGAAPEEARTGHLRNAAEVFGKREGWRLFFAPGRANLMGAHLDYNGGPVMPTTVDRGTYIAIRPRSDRRVILRSVLEEGVGEFELGALPDTSAGRWYDYPLGVLREAHLRAGSDGRGASKGLEVLFGGNLPIGAGLSSSASICVGFALALDALFDLGGGPDAWVGDALQAERGFVGVQCGIMDPFAVGHGRRGQLLWLDCLDRSFQHVPIDASRLAIAVADSGVRRELASSSFNERVAECQAACRALAGPSREVIGREPRTLREVPAEVAASELARLDPVLARRASHVFSELERTFAAREALEAGDPGGFGRRMTESHASLRDAFEVSTPELDHLVAEATAVPGVLGSRLTGAGFGGCTVILLERGAEGELRERLARSYAERFGREPRVDCYTGDEGPRELAVP